MNTKVMSSMGQAPSDTREVLAGLKILVAVAKADGVIHDNERLAIENALDDLELPDGTTATSLLERNVDVDAMLEVIRSPEVKRQTFDSACALAYVDGEATAVERALLERVGIAFGLGDQVAASERVQRSLERAFARVASGDEADTTRDGAIDDEIARFSLLGASLASASLPSFCEGIDAWNNVRLARKVGSFYGRRGDARYWKTFVSNVIGSASSWFAVSLLARLVPVSSRIASAYASTYALGRTTKLYFDENEVVETDVLRSAFKDAKKEGLMVARQGRVQAKIDDKTASIEKVKAGLDAELGTAKVSEDEYMQRLVSLD